MRQLNHAADAEGPFLPFIMNAHQQHQPQTAPPQALFRIQIPLVEGIDGIAIDQIDREFCEQPPQERSIACTKGCLPFPQHRIFFSDLRQDASAFRIHHIHFGEQLQEAFILLRIRKNFRYLWRPFLRRASRCPLRGSDVRRDGTAAAFRLLALMCCTLKCCDLKCCDLKCCDQIVSGLQNPGQPLLFLRGELFPSLLFILRADVLNRRCTQEQESPSLHAGKTQVDLLVGADSHVIPRVLLTGLAHSLFAQSTTQLAQMLSRQKRTGPIRPKRDVLTVALLLQILRQLLPDGALLYLVIIEGVLIHIHFPLLTAGVRTCLRKTVEF